MCSYDSHSWRATWDMQNQEEKFFTFDSMNMRWALSSHPNVFILKCDADLDGFDREQLLLHCELPSKVAAEQPAPVTSISIKYESKDLVSMRKINTLDQFVEEDDGFANASDDEKIVVKDLLREELVREKARRLSALAEKRCLIQEMMTREDMSVEALEET